MQALHDIKGQGPTLGPPKTESAVRTVPVAESIAVRLATHIEEYVEVVGWRADSLLRRASCEVESPVELLLVPATHQFPVRFLQPPDPPRLVVALPLSEPLDEPDDAGGITRPHPAERMLVLPAEHPPAQHEIVVPLLEIHQLGSQCADGRLAVLVWIGSGATTDAGG